MENTVNMDKHETAESICSSVRTEVSGILDRTALQLGR